MAGASLRGKNIAQQGHGVNLLPVSRGVIASGEFAEMIASRQALAFVSKPGAAVSADERLAPAANEFAATDFFRAVGSWDRQASDYGAQAIELIGDRPLMAQNAPAGCQVVPIEGRDIWIAECIEAGTSSESAPVDFVAGAGNSAESYQFSAAPGRKFIPASNQIQAVAWAAPPLALIGTLSDRSAFQAERAGRPQTREPLRQVAFNINLVLDGKNAAVSGRVAGLSQDETLHLDRRIREELLTARLSVREIRLNGRRSRTEAEE